MRGSKVDLPATIESDEAVIREAEWADIHVGFETYSEDFDLTPLLKGLPDDRCQCPHFGYVLKGRMRVRYADRKESWRPATPTTWSRGTPRSWRRAPSWWSSAPKTSIGRRWRSPSATSSRCKASRTRAGGRNVHRYYDRSHRPRPAHRAVPRAGALGITPTRSSGAEEAFFLRAKNEKFVDFWALEDGLTRMRQLQPIPSPKRPE